MGTSFCRHILGSNKRIECWEENQHVVLEGNHCLVVFYAKKEACVHVKTICKHVVHFPIEKITQEPCEGC
jgi:hypothetical protein